MLDSLANPIPNIQDAKHRDELYFCHHALEKMFERGITLQRVEQALDCVGVEVLESYPPVGLPSSHCLIIGKDGDGKYLHVVVAYPVRVEITTVYEPLQPKWITPRRRGVK